MIIFKDAASAVSWAEQMLTLPHSKSSTGMLMRKMLEYRGLEEIGDYSGMSFMELMDIAATISSHANNCPNKYDGFVFTSIYGCQQKIEDAAEYLSGQSIAMDVLGGNDKNIKVKLLAAMVMRNYRDDELNIGRKLPIKTIAKIVCGSKSSYYRDGWVDISSAIRSSMYGCIERADRYLSIKLQEIGVIP